MTVDKLGIVADDLTGAMDSSGYFAARGWNTVVILDSKFSSNADVVVLNTDSRSDSPVVATEKVRQAVRNLHGRALFKKIDSTLRGNIAAELDAALTESGCEKTIVCPAFPAMGRTVADGVLLVNGMPVAETQFARDPVSPVTESHIPTLLRKATKRQVGCVGVADIEHGAQSHYQRITKMPQEIIICDAVSKSHLAAIAKAADLAAGRWLLCGSSGLAREVRLSSVKGYRAGKTTATHITGQALVVIGSRNPVVSEQLRLVKDSLGIPVLRLDFAAFEEEYVLQDELEWILAEARHLLHQGKGLAISAADSEYVPSLKDVIPVVMAEVVTGILDFQTFAGVFLTGGDVAGAVCRRLAVSAIKVLGEVESGIPVGKAVGGPWQGLRVVTKAGGFGTPAALAKSITYLQKGRS